MPGVEVKIAKNESLRDAVEVTTSRGDAEQRVFVGILEYLAPEFRWQV